ncbi:MAG: hypothetical protein M1505_02295 [Patescibacteria group bacterium]|nr:hypothetical protein [Patescibacteria group bacterium]MCL5258032.1 hypothetical protein [Patescibacteria group bacterium]
MVEVDLETKVFDRVVRIYQKTAKPVGSKILSKNFFPDVSSSNLRLILSRLVNRRLLENVNFSAGRRPTDRGWRLYFYRKLKRVKNKSNRTKFSAEEFLADVAKQTKTYCLVKAGPVIKECSFVYVLAEPEFKERRMIVDFLAFVEKLKIDLDQIFLNLAEGENKIFIGSETPISRAEQFFLMIRKNNNQGLIMSGVKRTDYLKNYSFLDLID